MRTYKHNIVLVAILVASLFAASFAFGERGYGGSRTVLVNKFGTCAQITNRNSLDLFIPTGTAGEWSNFRSLAPNISVGCISTASFTIGYAGFGPTGTVTIQCGDGGTIGLRYQPDVYNTCSYPLYTGPTFDSAPGYVRSDGGCNPIPQPPYGRVNDFTYGTGATYVWQTHSGNGCNSGCGQEGVTYDGANTFTFYGTALTQQGNVTVTWDAAGNPIVSIPPPPCDPNDPNGACYSPPPDQGGDSFPAGTRVLTAGHVWKTIETIAVGDSVIGSDGKVNHVIGLYRPTLGNRGLYEINGEFATTKDHLLKMSSGRWGALGPEDYETLRFGKTMNIMVGGGKTVERISSAVPPEDVQKIEVGSSLGLFNGATKVISSIVPLSGYSPETVLYTLVTDGSESFTVQGGYVADGMPQK